MKQKCNTRTQNTILIITFIFNPLLERISHGNICSSKELKRGKLLVVICCAQTKFFSYTIIIT
jgi:hypothetical protein